MKTLKIASLAAGLAGLFAAASLPVSAASIPAVKPAGVASDVTAVRYGHHGGHGGHHRHWRGGPAFGFAVGVPVYSGSYYSGCGWLHRRAVNTGSRYWWRRYRECRGW